MGTMRDGWYVVPIDVGFRDIDVFGHVNNAVFFTYFETARTALWFELTGGKEPLDIGFIVARAECDFRAQIRMERIEVLVRISEMRNTSIDFVYEIRKEDGTLAATGKVVVVLFDWTTRTKKPVDDELRRKVEAISRES